jgi:hypothetical protein
LGDSESEATVGNTTVMTNTSDPTVGNSTVGSGDTANRTRGDSSDNTPKTSGAKEDESLEEVKQAGSQLSKFFPGQQQFLTVSKPKLNTEHKTRYLGVMSGKTAVSLFNSYTKSIDQFLATKTMPQTTTGLERNNGQNATTFSCVS